MLRRAVFVSPHLDDVAFSCGGTVWALGKAGVECTVLTVFAGTPISPFSNLAQAIHAVCGLDCNAVERRRQEDRHAVTAIGATPRHLDFTDAIYRRSLDGDSRYMSHDALVASIDPGDTNLAASICTSLYEDPVIATADILVAPAAIGGHVDHVITRRFAEIMGELRSTDVILYEDLPYACRSASSLPARNKNPTGSTINILSDAAWGAKINAVLCYESQIRMLWSTPETAIAELRRHAEQLVEGCRGERFWRQPPWTRKGGRGIYAVR